MESFERHWLARAPASERLCWTHALGEWSVSERAWALDKLNVEDARDRAWGLGPLAALSDSQSLLEARLMARVALWKAGRGDARGPWAAGEALARERMFDASFEAWTGKEHADKVAQGAAWAARSLGGEALGDRLARNAKLASMAQARVDSSLARLARKALGPIERQIVLEVFGA